METNRYRVTTADMTANSLDTAAPNPLAAAKLAAAQLYNVLPCEELKVTPLGGQYYLARVCISEHQARIGDQIRVTPL